MPKAYPHFLFIAVMLVMPLWSFGQQPSDEELKAQTKAFEAAKGKLHCPSSNGFIDRGKLYLEADLKTSGGVDVKATSDSVLAIFDGIVVSAIPAGDLGFSLIVSHGEYFAVYSQIESVLVESKQKVSKGQFIGIALPANPSGFLFHLELWKNTDKLFPGEWIKCE